MNLRVFGPAVAAGLAVAVVAAAASSQDLPFRAAPGHPAAIAVADATAAAPAAPGPGGSGPGQGFLINGDRVLATDHAGGAGGAGGGPAATVVAPASRGLAGSVITLGLDGRTYQVPAAAVPYLGRGLDLSLFDARTLLAKQAGGRLPVSLGYHGSTPALPGVVITSSGHGAARGYLTAASAQAFGAALDRQYAADHARDSYGTDGLFAGGVSIALAGTASPARPASATRAAPPGQVHPDYPMHTLTVNATNTSGQPDTGDYVLLFNVDNSGLLNELQEAGTFYQGTTKYSVPAGHYSAVGVFFNAQSSLYAVVVPQFTVTGNTTVSIAARSATSQIAMVTPRPATAASTGFYVVRTAAQGPLTYMEFLNSSPIWVNPEHRKPTVGTLQTYANQVLASAASQSGTPYSYELSYTDPPGIIPAQRYRVRRADLATVNENFYQASPSSGSWIMLGSFPTTNQLTPFIGFVEPVPIPLSLPGRLTVYVGGAGSAPMVWASDYASSNGDYQASETGRQFRAGTQVTDDWGAYPLHPAPNAMLYLPKNVLGLTPVSAARNGDTLWLDATPFSDNQPGHLGVGFFPVPGLTATGSYQVQENGTVVAAGNAVTAAERGVGDVPVQATLSPNPGTVRFELTAALAGPAFGLSTATQTVWTWRSAPVAGAKLPGDWICAAIPLSTSLSPDCAVQPMMTLDYGVVRLGLDGMAPAGRQVLDVTAGHIQPARNTRITGASVWVSLNGGQTWRAARVTRTGARTFRAVFNAPAGTYVMLRTRATDAAGGSITEVITRAYAIAP